ncbi:hypothetical protein LUZ61_017489 [Rhynchospora tenuis]|uniref:Plant bHLH transcription factor ACT-like domain-containing protein n=1 Tax=Rhynchospora tenuis TaxID=198213 RepID=A0AAD5Z7K1_9POAL|nr:hypothetical protein LUZ61_017489 [Rhynchospora tenuis]
MWISYKWEKILPFSSSSINSLHPSNSFHIYASVCCVSVRQLEREREMVSREKKIHAGLHDKLQLLRSLTKSNALNETSIVLDASRYIKELKQKVMKLNRELAASQSIISDNQSPLVNVDTIENGFLINVFLNKTNPGLLVSILEAFEELGLSVMEASASCADSFCLEAFGGENQTGDLDAYVVKEAVLQAIRNCDED